MQSLTLTDGTRIRAGRADSQPAPVERAYAAHAGGGPDPRLGAPSPPCGRCSLRELARWLAREDRLADIAALRADMRLATVAQSQQLVRIADPLRI